MANPSDSTTHGLYLTGNFEVEKKASKVWPTNGNKEYEVGSKSDTDNGEDIKPNVSSKKPAKFVPAPLNAPFKSPVVSTDLASTPTLAFGSHDSGPPSMSPASSRPTPGPSHSSSDTATFNLAPTPLGKKRGRAQPKRSGKKGKTLDLTEEA
ncbi:uncharacterized protein MELLADRAFT_108144 [Melampsora larici-populina 98AG31]|uniref:Uncharacterized protein n=1 Tax=Melampsora larici-populina (strain 98AG31 / pathotype 3-4-7) TaxID=747676 RepID=F4RS40_MELLP|nr:uncharacterized protein MELLADRAFT_108144 [Melampsora larici-populina 98AG31]EGG04841.1 hypothetical protein MELLADRAFT_108144 [Melampsora larici-populina 98AG31]